MTHKNGSIPLQFRTINRDKNIPVNTQLSRFQFDYLTGRTTLK